MIYFVVFILLSVGFMSLSNEILGLPPYATAKGVKLATKKEQPIVNVLLQTAVMPVVKLAAPLIIMVDFKEKRMSKQLKRAGIPLSPKEYCARSIVMAVGTGILSYIMLACTMKKMSVVAIILGVVVYFHFNGEIKDKLKAKDKLIEAELPKFIRAVVQGLKTEKDIIKLLETYQTIAGPGLKYDIEVLIMDLKSGNFEEGMTEFDKRLGNSYVSRLSKALIAVNRGDDQSSMLNYLLSDMGLLAKEMMQRELNKRPGRVKMLVIPIVIVAVAALFYVIGMNLFTSLGGIM